MDPTTIARGTDRWLTDSRVYNLVWLGRWIERAQGVARVLLWSAQHDATNRLEEVLAIAAEICGVTVAEDESALDVLLIRGIGTVLETLERHDPPPATPAEVGALMQRTLGLLHDLHAVPSEEEVSRRFVQRQ